MIWNGFRYQRTSDQGEEVRRVLLRRLLFETKVGELLLALLEKRAGLAVIQAEGLGAQPSGTPPVASGE